MLQKSVTTVTKYFERRLTNGFLSDQRKNIKKGCYRNIS